MANRPYMGLRIEIPAHYGAWMRGARFGRVTGYGHARPGQSDYILVTMDHPDVPKRLRVWRIDWDYLEIVS